MLLVCAIAGLALPVCLYLLSSARAEARRISLRITDESDISSRLSRLAGDVEQLRRELRERAEPAPPEKPETVTSEYSPGSYALNLNKRGQVLQLHRRGDSVSSIAQVLHLARAEVRLVIRVHELSASRGIKHDLSL